MPILYPNTDPALIERVFSELDVDAAEINVYPDSDGVVDDPGFFFTPQIKALFDEYDVRYFLNTLYASDGNSSGSMSGNRGDFQGLERPDLTYGFWAKHGVSILQTDEPRRVANYLNHNGYRLELGNPDYSVESVSVTENDKGAIVADVNVGNPDAEAFAYQIVDSKGVVDDRFEIVAGSNGHHSILLKEGVSLDFEDKASVTRTLLVSEDGGEPVGTDFTIHVTDVAEAIDGTKKADTLKGGNGADIIKAFAGNDTLIGNDGDDRLDGGDGADTLKGGADRDVLRGGTGDDRLYGDTQDDRLFGDAGADRLDGGTGNDTLTGGKGLDQFLGGAGSDTFVFETGDTGKSRAKADTIHDFAKADTIDLGGFDANESKRGVQDFEFIGTHGFGKHAGELRYEMGKSDTWIEGDTDGDGKADFVIHLDDAVKLTASHFDF